jgi:hypothetical protein
MVDLGHGQTTCRRRVVATRRLATPRRKAASREPARASSPNVHALSKSLRFQARATRPNLPTPGRRRRAAQDYQRPTQPVLTFLEMASEPGEGPENTRQPLRLLGVTNVLVPAQRCPDVRPLGISPVPDARRSRHRRSGTFRQAGQLPVPFAEIFHLAARQSGSGKRVSSHVIGTPLSQAAIRVVDIPIAVFRLVRASS